MRAIRIAIVLFALSIFNVPIIGCATKAQTGAAVGAGAGAAAGYIIGNEMDKQDDDHHHH